MAEGNHCSHSDPTAADSAQTSPRDRLDTLAELARLLDQTLPINNVACDARRPTLAGNRSALPLNPLTVQGCAASDVLQETTEELYSTPEQGSCEVDPPSDTYDGGRFEPSPRVDVSRQSRSDWYEHEPPSSNPADLHVESSGAWYGEYENQSLDQPEDHGVDYDEHPNLRRRDKFIFVATVFGLALLCFGSGFALRALLADSIVPALMSIITSESGPNKIIKSSLPPQSNVDKAGSGGEERPVNIPQPVNTTQQPVSSVPISPEPAPPPGPSAASMFPLTPLAQPAPVAGVDSVNSPPALPTAADAPTSTTAAPTVPGPKKIRTVSIRTDRPNAADSVPRQPQSVPVRPAAQQQVAKPSDANAPLPMAPLSNDVATAAGAARTASPVRPAPAREPVATRVASTSAAASSGRFAVQVSSQSNENEVQSSFRSLQAKYPKLLGGREPMVRRADLGAKGVYYRAMVGPFGSAKQANELCANLKAAGGNCIVQNY
jgi:hypothetical protein